MIKAIEGPELTNVNLKKFRTAEHSNSIVSVFMTVHSLISVFASLVSCIMFSVRERFCGGKSQGSPLCIKCCQCFIPSGWCVGLI